QTSPSGLPGPAVPRDGFVLPEAPAGSGPRRLTTARWFRIPSPQTVTTEPWVLLPTPLPSPRAAPVSLQGPGPASSASRPRWRTARGTCARGPSSTPSGSSRWPTASSGLGKEEQGRGCPQVPSEGRERRCHIPWHCSIKSFLPPLSRDISRWEVVIGATDLTQPGPEVELRHIRRLLVHQHYVATAARNNIALLELAQPVECSDYIQLACVPDSSLAVPELKTCYIAGWRAAPGSAPGPRLALQEAKVRLMDAQLCNSSRWYGGALHPQDLCAGYPRGGIDTCQVRAWAQGHRDPRAPNTAPSNPQTQHRDP
uniref:Uncharacterized protein n=1 Tax=Corvus moneduloides TaxID=1196302 RepID=A0A8U7MAS9_CORMO